MPGCHFTPAGFTRCFENRGGIKNFGIRELLLFYCIGFYVSVMGGRQNVVVGSHSDVYFLLLQYPFYGDNMPSLRVYGAGVQGMSCARRYSMTGLPVMRHQRIAASAGALIAHVRAVRPWCICSENLSARKIARSGHGNRPLSLAIFAFRIATTTLFLCADILLLAVPSKLRQPKFMEVDF